MLRATSVALYIAGIGVLLLGCTRATTPEDLQALFDEGERLCLEAQWGEAQVVLRDYLMRDPENPGAHFYLGRTYLMARDFRPAIAEGEYQTALQFFEESGRESPIARFEPEYFELICNLESAKVCLRHIEWLLSNGYSGPSTQRTLYRAYEYAGEAERVFPRTDEVRDLYRLLRSVPLASNPGN